MNNVFICAHANFPRGGAEANYVEYMALTLMERGHEVYVFSRGEINKFEYNTEKKCCCHNGIYYDNISGEFSTFYSFAKLYFRESGYLINLLKKYGADEGDQLILYTTNYFCIRGLYKYASFNNIKTTMCITEWYQPFQYKGGILNPVYWLDELGFQKGIPMSKSVLPISRKLESFFKSKGCKTLCLPILANPPEIITGTNYNKQVIDFIYSGNAVKKDAIDMVIKSFARLSDEELRKVRLHFTGMGQNTISYLQRKCGMDYKRIEPILTIHTWMQYEDLITLYQKMDFLVLLRRINKVTLSNFPSKVPEMMGYGVIPVVSKVGDYTEEYLADGKDCIMINGCNEAEAVKGIRRALSMSAEERNNMRHNAHETVENKFLYSLWSDKIEDFLYGE